MKKVLAIAPYAYLPFTSGGQKYIAKFLENLARHASLTVISVPGNDATLAQNYRLVPLMKKGFSRYWDRTLISGIVEIIKKDAVDWVICEHPYLAWLVLAIKKRTGLPVYIHTHNIEYQRFRSLGKWWWPILKIYERRCFRNASGVFFIIPQDRDFAIQTWKLDPSKCFDVPFGIDTDHYPVDRPSARSLVLNKYNLGGETKIILFAAQLGYPPNRQALDNLLVKVNPLLLKNLNRPYKLIICGTGLDRSYRSLADYSNAHVIYAGFIPKIETFFKAADISLNPVQSGGGIKTKMIEAIGYGSPVIATESGAYGVHEEKCGEQLIVVADNDWNSFANAIIDHIDQMTVTPVSFYDYYSWKNIITALYQSLIESTGSTHTAHS